MTRLNHVLKKISCDSFSIAMLVLDHVRTYLLYYLLYISMTFVSHKYIGLSFVSAEIDRILCDEDL